MSESDEAETLRELARSVRDARDDAADGKGHDAAYHLDDVAIHLDRMATALTVAPAAPDLTSRAHTAIEAHGGTLDGTELYERLAAIQHDIWAHWMRYLLGAKSYPITTEPTGRGLREADVAHWWRQIDTPYDQLTEAEKASDREQVDRYWHLVAPGGVAPGQGRELFSPDNPPPAEPHSGCPCGSGPGPCPGPDGRLLCDLTLTEATDPGSEAMAVLRELVDGEDHWSPERDERYQAARRRARTLVEATDPGQGETGGEEG